MPTSRSPRPYFVLPLLLLAVAAAGCGGATSSGPASSTASSTASPAGGSGGGYGGYGGYGAGGGAPSTASSTATLSVRGAGALGSILADGSGRTLYLFAKDQGGTSSCSGQCAQAWPPFTSAGTPAAGPGVTASLIGTTKRPDGTSQVTYAGHPLYYYAADSQPGQTLGQGLNQFGARWYVLSRQGTPVTKG